jgi:hypothetical protein
VQGGFFFYPMDEDLSMGTPDFHPMYEDLSMGTPDLVKKPLGNSGLGV